MDYSAAELPKSPPIRLVRPALSQHVALHVSASCRHKPQDRPSTFTFFFASGLRHMHKAPRQAYWNQPFEGPAWTSIDDRAHRLAYTFADGARPTFAGPPWTTGTVLEELTSGLLLCGPPWKEQAVLVECLGFLVWHFFSVHALSYGIQYMRRSVLRVGQSGLPFC